jgi:hypothetical protein
MESEVSLLCSQELATGPYPETDECSPYHPIFSLTSILILFSYYVQDFLAVSSGFPTENLHKLIIALMLVTCPAPLILLDLAKRSRNEVPHYVILFCLLLSHSTWIQVYSMAAYSELHSVYLLPFVPEIT